MKTHSILLLLLVTSVCNISRAQYIKDFLDLRKNNLEEINLKFSNLNWQFYKEREQLKNDMTVYTFKNINKVSDIMWIDYIYRPRHCDKNRLSFQVQSKELFNQLISEIKNLGFYYIYQENASGEDIMLYSNNEETIEIISSKNKDLHNDEVFNFTFYNKLEYDAIFQEENPLENNPFTSISLYNNQNKK